MAKREKGQRREIVHQELPAYRRLVKQNRERGFSRYHSKLMASSVVDFEFAKRRSSSERVSEEDTE